MTRDALREAFAAITIWKRGTQRAPHKPLLLLLALGQWSRDRTRRLPFEEVAPKLTQLLEEFGPPRKAHHPEYPFWRLQNDGLWTLQGDQHVERRQSNTDAKKSELLKHDVSGGLRAEIYEVLEAHPELVQELAHSLLDAHFPESLHADILEAVGLRHTYVLHRRPNRVRDPAFRYQVLTAYERRCAVCGFDVRLGTTTIGIEAAHIQWFQAGGPDELRNGLALCALHHKLFDRGAFTITRDFNVQVSEHAHGTVGFEDWLFRHHGAHLRRPVSESYLPDRSFLRWHHQEVFRAPARR